MEPVVNNRIFTNLTNSEDYIDQKPSGLKNNTSHFLKNETVPRVEKEIDISNLKDLMIVFQSNVNEETGCISSSVFSSIFGNVMGGVTANQLLVMFMQIDVDCDGLINWDDFSSFLLLRSEGQKLMKDQNDGNYIEEESNLKRHVSTHHKEMIVRV